jgi:hypothetical protein
MFKVIPIKARIDNFSFISKNPASAVIGGDADIISNDILEPISTNASNKNKSPNTKPNNPDIKSQNHVLVVASVGRISPLVI